MATQLLKQAYWEAQIWLADPVQPGTGNIPGDTQNRLNNLWALGLKIVAVLCAFAAAGAFASMMWQRSHGGGSGDSEKRLGYVAGGALGVGMAAGLAGMLTGT